jgi:hypothetical protein
MSNTSELKEEKLNVVLSKDNIVSVARYRGISTSSHIIKYSQGEMQVSSE